jgi:hypothetical protein
MINPLMAKQKSGLEEEMKVMKVSEEAITTFVGDLMKLRRMAVAKMAHEKAESNKFEDRQRYMKAIPGNTIQASRTG